MSSPSTLPASCVPTAPTSVLLQRTASSAVVQSVAMASCASASGTLPSQTSSCRKVGCERGLGMFFGKKYALHERYVDGDSAGTGGFEAGKKPKKAPEGSDVASGDEPPESQPKQDEQT